MPAPLRTISRMSLAAALLAGAAPLVAQTPGGTLERPVRTLSLEDALTRAGEVSKPVGIARAGVERARGDQLRARSEYYPQLAGSAAYTRTLASQFSRVVSDSLINADTTVTTGCARFAADPTLPVGARLDSLERAVTCLSSANPFAAFGNLPFGQRNQYNFGLSASQTLYAGGRIRAQVRSADAGRRSAEIELAAQEAQARLDVVQAYFDAALSDRLLAIADSTLAQSERTLADVRLAKQVGNQPEFELLRATVTRDNGRPVVIQRRAQRDIAYLRLKQLLDLPLGDSLDLTTTLGDAAGSDSVLPPPPSVAAQLGDTATAGRAPVRQAAEAVASEEGQLGVAKAGALPLVRVTSQFARIGYPKSGLPSWDDFVSDWNVALSVSVPLFTGGRLKGDRMVARANLDAAKLRLTQAEQVAAVDTRTALSQLAAAEASWLASAGTTAQARRAYAIAEIRYREGISTQTEISDSRLLLQQAEANRAQAARDLQVARTRMALLRDLPLAGQAAAGAGGASGAAAGGSAATAPAPASPATPATTGAGAPSAFGATR
jgi:outer membrane protein TolC